MGSRRRDDSTGAVGIAIRVMAFEVSHVPPEATPVESGVGAPQSKALRASRLRASPSTAQPFWSALRPRSAFNQRNRAEQPAISITPSVATLVESSARTRSTPERFALTERRRFDPRRSRFGVRCVPAALSTSATTPSAPRSPSHHRLPAWSETPPGRGAKALRAPSRPASVSAAQPLWSACASPRRFRPMLAANAVPEIGRVTRSEAGGDPRVAVAAGPASGHGTTLMT